MTGDLTVSDQASLEGYAGDTARYADGVLASGRFVMDGGSLTAVGGNSVYNTYGMFIGGTAEISAGKADIRSGDIVEGASEEDGAVSQACGFYSGGTTCISGGETYVQAGDNVHYTGSPDNKGAALSGAGLEITGGTVQAVCTSDGTAVQAFGQLVIADTMTITTAKRSTDSFDMKAVVTDNVVTCAGGETLPAVCVMIKPAAPASC